MEFKPFEKIARLKRECTITEKIDGTNAQICIVPLNEALRQIGEPIVDPNVVAIQSSEHAGNGIGFAMFAGSRTRWITPDSDNFGFARWVQEHAAELWTLGPGSHYGEWWGGKIQRGYGITEKRFSLFNVVRWNAENPNRPACCAVVPHLFTGPFSTDTIDFYLNQLREIGSLASPGFMKPEGIVTYLHAARTYFKTTIEGDEEPKEARERRLAYEAKQIALVEGLADRALQNMEQSVDRTIDAPSS